MVADRYKLATFKAIMTNANDKLLVVSTSITLNSFWKKLSIAIP